MNNNDLIPSGGNQSWMPIFAEWNIKAVRDGEVIHEETKTNLIVDNGRENILNHAFGFTASGTINSMAAGACSTAADEPDYRLGYEHILNGTRAALTNQASSAVVFADIVSEQYVDGLGNVYRKKLIVVATYAAGDANNGHPFQEYGLFTSLSVPVNPAPSTAQQTGIMFNHLVAGSPITKDGSTEIVVTVTLRV